MPRQPRGGEVGRPCSGSAVSRRRGAHAASTPETVVFVLEMSSMLAASLLLHTIPGLQLQQHSPPDGCHLEQLLQGSRIKLNTHN